MLYELPPGTQLHTFWNQLETTQKHRKRSNLTGKCLKQKVVPGLFQSSQATVLELWASLDLLRPPWTQLDTSRSHQDNLVLDKGADETVLTITVGRSGAQK